MAIGDKTVTIESKRPIAPPCLSLYDFSRRNCDLAPEAIAARNRDVLLHG